MCGVGDASAFHLVLFWVWLWNLAGDCFSLGCACFCGLLIGIVVIGFTLGLTLFDTNMNKIIPSFLHTFSTFSTYFSTFYSLFNIPKSSLPVQDYYDNYIATGAPLFQGEDTDIDAIQPFIDGLDKTL